MPRVLEKNYVKLLAQVNLGARTTFLTMVFPREDASQRRKDVLGWRELLGQVSGRDLPSFRVSHL